MALIATKMRLTAREKLIHDALEEVELTRKAQLSFSLSPFMIDLLIVK